MKFKSFFLVILILLVLLTSCDFIWRVSDGVDISFTLDTSSLPKSFLSPSSRSIDDDDNIPTISLHNAQSDDVIISKTISINDDDRTVITFSNLQVIGKSVYAKIQIFEEEVVYEGVSNVQKMVEGENYLYINELVEIVIMPSVYLNGQYGNDSFSGLDSTNAVLTFEAAKALLPNGGIIYVTNKIDVTTDENWSSDEDAPLIVKRHESYSGVLIEVSGTDNTNRSTLTLEDITIDGNKRSVEAMDSIIFAHFGNINLNNGAVLQNNMSTGSAGGIRLGSGGYFDNKENATLTMMEGSRIQNNSSESSLGAGGVRINDNSEFNMLGGIITNNISHNLQDAAGGVYVGVGSDFTMSGGTISNNSGLYTGGIYLDSTGPSGGTTVLSGEVKIINNIGGDMFSFPFISGEDSYSFVSASNLSDDAMIHISTDVLYESIILKGGDLSLSNFKLTNSSGSISLDPSGAGILYTP